MEIIWHGQSFFEIEGRENGNKVVIAINPFDKSIGLRPKKVKPDILLVSQARYNYSKENTILGQPFLIKEPGEYEVKGVKIKSIPSHSGKEKELLNIIFILEIEGIKICHLGYFSEKELSEAGIEDIIKTQILLVPVGGDFTISGREAAKLVEQIDPKIVIPMHYDIRPLGSFKLPKAISSEAPFISEFSKFRNNKISGPKVRIEDEKPFLRAMGIKRVEKIKKLKIKQSEMGKKENREIIVLEAI